MNDYDGLYFALQKAIGLIIILLSLLILVITRDATGPLFTIFLGVVPLVSNEKILFVDDLFDPYISEGEDG